MELSEQKPAPPSPPRGLGGASDRDGAVDRWGCGLPRGAGNAERAGRGGRRGVEACGVWRSCGRASRSPRAGRLSPKVSVGRWPGAAPTLWRHPWGARQRQVWFGRTGPGTTSARSRSAGRGRAAGWREPREGGREGDRVGF